MDVQGGIERRQCQPSGWTLEERSPLEKIFGKAERVFLPSLICGGKGGISFMGENKDTLAAETIPPGRTSGNM